MMQVDVASVEKILQDWPKTARESAHTVMKKYGSPDEATPTVLCWYNNGPWKWSMLFRVETPHEFPTPRVDVLEQAIDYRVPLDRVGEVVRSDHATMSLQGGS